MQNAGWKSGAVVAAVAAVASLGTSAANAGPLPGGQKVVAAPAGWSVVLKSTGNSAAIQPTMATPQSRSAWLTTTGSVEVKAPTDAKDVQGKLGVGLVSGCQFPGAIGGGVSVSGPTATLGSTPSVGLGGVSPSLSIPLSPGSTSSVTGFGQSDQPSAIDSIKFSKSGTYEVIIKNQNVDIAFCSGYAQARVVTWVEIKGSNRIQGFLYGAPFSLG